MVSDIDLPDKGNYRDITHVRESTEVYWANRYHVVPTSMLAVQTFNSC